MATVYLVKGVTDPANIVSAEAEIEGKRFAIVVGADGSRSIYGPGEWAESEEKANEKVQRNIANRVNVRAKTLPELIAKAKERVAELEAEYAASKGKIADVDAEAAIA